MATTPEYDVLTAPPTVAGVIPSAEARAGSTVICSSGSAAEALLVTPVSPGTCFICAWS